MGRKKLTEGDRVDVRLRMEPAFAAKIQAAADAQGNSVAAWIRTAAAEKLGRTEQPLPIGNGKG